MAFTNMQEDEDLAATVGQYEMIPSSAEGVLSPWARGLADFAGSLSASQQWRRPIWAIALLGILAFNFWMGMSPHWDYPYPLHVDEWAHLARTQEILDTDDIRRGDSLDREFGFHVVLGFVQELTGLSWSGLYRITPGVLMAFLALAVWAVGARSGFGWAAAMLLPLIPTSIRVLGPAFVAPVVVALLFIPLTILVLTVMERRGNRESFIPLFVLISGPLFIHATTEATITMLAAFALVFAMAQPLALHHYRESLQLIAAMALRIGIPVIIFGLWLPGLAREAIGQSVPSGVFSGDSGSAALVNSGTLVGILGFHDGFFEAFGSVGVALFLVGAALLVFRIGSYVYFSIVATALCLVVFLLFLFPRYGLGPDRLYERAWLHLGVLMVIIGGFAVASTTRFGLNWVQASLNPPVNNKRFIFGIVLGTTSFGLLLAALVFGLTSSTRSAYQTSYRLVNEVQALDIAWIGNHDPQGSVAMEPSLAFAAPVLSGPKIQFPYKQASPFSRSSTNTVSEMVATGKIDVGWLRKRGIVFLYTCLPASSGCTDATGQGVSEVRPGLYWIPP